MPAVQPRRSILSIQVEPEANLGIDRPESSVVIGSINECSPALLPVDDSNIRGLVPLPQADRDLRKSTSLSIPLLNSRGSERDRGGSERDSRGSERAVERMN